LLTWRNGVQPFAREIVAQLGFAIAVRIASCSFPSLKSKSTTMSVKANRILHWQFTRFVAVGLFNTAFFFVIFSLAKNYVGLSRALAVTLAYAISTIVQYSTHSTFTFGRTIWNGGQAIRFVTTITLGYLISQLVMFVGQQLGMPVIISVGFLGVTIALVNWVVFSSWVFEGNAG
jgi:putative flippase GtrA